MARVTIEEAREWIVNKRPPPCGASAGIAASGSSSSVTGASATVDLAGGSDAHVGTSSTQGLGAKSGRKRGWAEGEGAGKHEEEERSDQSPSASEDGQGMAGIEKADQGVLMVDADDIRQAEYDAKHTEPKLREMDNEELAVLALALQGELNETSIGAACVSVLASAAAATLARDGVAFATAGAGAAAPDSVRHVADDKMGPYARHRGCLGLSLVPLFGYDDDVAHRSVPFAATFPVELPELLNWDIEVDLVSGVAHSRRCLGSSGGKLCNSCSSEFQKLPFRNAMARSRMRVPTDGCIDMYWTFQQMSTRKRDLRDILTNLRLENMNLGRKLNSAAEKCRLSDLFLEAFSCNDVHRLPVLVMVARQRGLGYKKILQLMKSAADGVYKVHSYSSKETDIMKLVLRVGGRSLCHAMAQALGLQSVDTVLRSCVGERFKFTHNRATMEEDADRNLASNASSPDVGRALYIVAEDEIFNAAKVTVGMCDSKGLVAGLCVEHPIKVPHTIEYVQELCDLRALVVNEQEKRTGKGPHLAKGSKVIAMQPCPSDSTHIKHQVAQAIFGAGVCMQGDSQFQLEVTLVVLKLWHMDRKDLKGVWSYHERAGRLVLWCTDGDSRRRVVWERLYDSEETSHISELLMGCAGMDKRVGPHGVCVCFDPKHLIKRVKTNFSQGLTIGDVELTRDFLQHLVREVANERLTEPELKDLFDTQDKMNVAAALRLLACLALLRECESQVLGGVSYDPNPTPKGTEALPEAVYKHLCSLSAPKVRAVCVLGHISDLILSLIDPR
jgi:hypothetical protein